MWRHLLASRTTASEGIYLFYMDARQTAALRRGKALEFSFLIHAASASVRYVNPQRGHAHL